MVPLGRAMVHNLNGLSTADWVSTRKVRPMTHDPSSPAKLLVPESRTRNLEAIAHVLFCPSFSYQTNLVPECMAD